MSNGNQSIPNRMANAAAVPLNYVGGAMATATYKGGMIWVWLSVILYLSDWFLLGFNGINFRNVINSITSGGINFIFSAVFNAVVLIILVFYIFFGRHNKEEIMSFSIAVMMSSLIFTMSGFNIASLIHLIFAWFMWNGLFKKAMPSSDANLMLALILFIDFFAFSLISSFGAMSFFSRLIIPVHFLFSLNYTQESGFKSFLVTMIVIFYILQVSSTFYDVKNFSESFGDSEKTTARQSVNRAIDNFIAAFTKTKEGVEKEITGYINDTKNDLQGTSYVSEVDANSKKDLGVSLENVGKDDLTLYNTNDSIRVTGILKGRSIDDDDKVKVLIRCYGIRSVDSKNKIYGNVKGKDTNITPYEINMGLYEEQFIDCEIPNAKKGDWIISFEAVFNFTSEGYLKTYYMDKDRYLSLRSQGVDVFSAFQITEKRPISKSVNGPGKIAIVTAEPPSLVSRDNTDSFGSYVGVSITNNWPGGKLNKVYDIQIKIPYGLKLESCEDRFTLLSTDSNTGEVTYKLDKDYVNRTLSLNIGDVRSEKCGLNLTNSNYLLGDSPFATKYFKAESTYEYLLKRSFQVNVKDATKTN